MSLAPMESSGFTPQLQNDLEGLLKWRLLGAISVADSAVWGSFPRSCISNELLGDADAAGPGTVL